MSNKISIDLLNSQYLKIKQQCVIKFFGFAGQEGADVFLRVNTFCQKQLTRYMGLLSCNLLQNKGKKSMFIEDEGVPCDFVQEAYSGFWDFGNKNDDDFEKDKFLAHHDHVYLMDWTENKNPYAELQKFRQDFIDEKFSTSDIAFVFKSFLAILNSDISLQETIHEVRSYLEEFFPNDVEDIL